MSVTFIGSPSVTTPELGDNTERIATTEFVQRALDLADSALQASDISLGDISNVSLNNEQINQVLAWNGVNWVNQTVSGGGGGTDISLDDISDVSLNNKQINQVLAWNGVNWVNQNVPGGGGGTVSSVGVIVPSGLVVTGSPITTTGDITIAYDVGYEGFLSAEKTKLAGIEAGATADQTPTELLTAIKTVDGTGSGLDADTVDGLESTAFATAAQGTLADSAVQPGANLSIFTNDSGYLLPDALNDYEITAQLNARDTANRSRANHTGTQTASTISDFDITVTTNANVVANTNKRHDPVTVINSSEINFTLAGQQITASIIDASLAKNKLDLDVQASLDLADSALQASDISLGDISDVSLNNKQVNQVLAWNGVNWVNQNVPGGGGGTVSSVGVIVPSGFVVTGSPITTTGDITIAYDVGYEGFLSAEKTKLAGIADGAEVNVNADWNAVSGDAQILNKPTLGTAAATDSTDYATAAQGTLADSALQPSALNDYETTSQLNARDIANRLWTNLTSVPDWITNATTFGQSLIQATSDTAAKALLNLTKSDVGLSNVDNTSDADKPISLATQLALDNKENADPTILKESDIGISIQSYSADTVIDANYVATENSYTTTEKNKLAGIEAGATADQTPTELLTAIKTVDGTGSGLDADTVDGLEASAFATAAQGTLADTAVQPAAIANFETSTQLNTRDTNNRNRANHTGTQTASTISDFDTEVSNNTDVAANTSARHVAVTVVDSSEIDLTLTGQQISASLVVGSIDETKLDTSVNASLDLADSALQPGTIGVTVQPYNANTVIDANYVATENSYTTTEKNKLAGIADGAEVNVNADWNAVSGDSQILNKPTLGTAAATDSTDYATTAQGALADTALQPGANVSELTNDAGYLTALGAFDGGDSATSTPFRFRRDTAANWSSNNPTLVAGELGLDTTKSMFKLGDETTAWNSLPYTTKETFVIPLGYLGALAVQEIDVAIVDMPFGFYIDNILLTLQTAATGSNFIVDINVDGTTILSTKLSIDAGETSSVTATTPYVLSTTPTIIASGSVLSVDIDQIGATTAGESPMLTIEGRRI